MVGEENQFYRKWTKGSTEFKFNLFLPKQSLISGVQLVYKNIFLNFFSYGLLWLDQDGPRL